MLWWLKPKFELLYPSSVNIHGAQCLRMRVEEHNFVLSYILRRFKLFWNPQCQDNILGQYGTISDPIRTVRNIRNSPKMEDFGIFFGNHPPKPKNYQKSTFYAENLNSEPTFICPTLKFLEINVDSEFWFSALKVDFCSFSGF